MFTVFTRTLLLTLLALLTAVSSSAAADQFIHFNLSLAGYHPGMSYEDALLVRPLIIIENTDPDLAEPPDSYIDAYVEQVYINDIMMNLRIRFKNDRIYKVLAHFSPENVAELSEIFKRTLGKGEDQSKVVANRDGKQTRQTVHFWDYPNAKLYMIKTSENDKFATVGLLAKPSYAETFVKPD